MDIKTASIFVADQGKALTFYTDILGFRKINDIDLGEFRWLTVSSDGSGETELLLEPNVHPAAKAFQVAIYDDGIPATVFHCDDIHDEFRRLSAQGVSFRELPTENGGVWLATFDDGCGNWIQLVQQ
ncbi:MAG: VOC family protein [Gammaproteobacteria bacterium]|nr:VOC family protein [Gammaproteobacteria bacterium]MDG2337825.1 VOC family protein [Gammaproteobacteria bacterium]